MDPQTFIDRIKKTILLTQERKDYFISQTEKYSPELRTKLISNFFELFLSISIAAMNSLLVDTNGFSHKIKVTLGEDSTNWSVSACVEVGEQIDTMSGRQVLSITAALLKGFVPQR